MVKLSKGAGLAQHQSHGVQGCGRVWQRPAPGLQAGPKVAAPLSVQRALGKEGFRARPGGVLPSVSPLEGRARVISLAWNRAGTVLYALTSTGETLRAWLGLRVLEYHG